MDTQTHGKCRHLICFINSHRVLPLIFLVKHILCDRSLQLMGCGPLLGSAYACALPPRATVAVSHGRQRCHKPCVGAAAPQVAGRPQWYSRRGKIALGHGMILTQSGAMSLKLGRHHYRLRCYPHAGAMVQASRQGGIAVSHSTILVLVIALCKPGGSPTNLTQMPLSLTASRACLQPCLWGAHAHSLFVHACAHVATFMFVHACIRHPLSLGRQAKKVGDPCSMIFYFISPTIQFSISILLQSAFGSH